MARWNRRLLAGAFFTTSLADRIFGFWRGGVRAGLLAVGLLTLAMPAAAQDTTSPTLSTATVDGTSLVLTYDEALDTTSTPAALTTQAVTNTTGGANTTASNPLEEA